MTTTSAQPDTTPAARPDLDPDLGPTVRAAIAKRTFATLATAGAGGRAHSAGVLYALADGALWISTMRDSRKARNVAENPAVALTVIIRRLPFGPPSSVNLQARATIVDLDDPEVRRLAASGALKAVTSHGELDLEGGCFIRVALPGRVPAYGIGMSLRRFLRDPLDAGRVAQVDWT